MRLPALGDDRLEEFVMPGAVSVSDSLPPEDRVHSTVAEQSFTRLYRAERPRLLRYFARRVGQEDALDLVHEAFASFMASMSRQSRTVEQPEAYLTTIANNLLAKRERNANRRSTALHVSADDAALAGPDLERQLEARDVFERLETAMLRLRPITREIFMAHRLDGYTYREIAERTGLSIKRVEKHMGRAIARLDDVLGADKG